MTRFEEKGILPIGVEVDGQLHREFTLRSSKVRDLIAVENRQGSNARVAALLARCLTRLGTLEPHQIDEALIQDMEYVDYEALVAADGRLGQRQLTFRNPGSAAGGAAPGRPDGVE